MRIVAGQYRNRSIKVPEGLEVRPTTNQMREGVFNICQHLIEDARFLDLFAGSGAMGLEALSRGAEFVTFVDNNKSSIRSITDNVKAFDVEDQVSVLFGDVFKLFNRLDTFTIIYIDPPYDVEDPDIYYKLLTEIDKRGLLEPQGRILVETKYKAKINLPLEGYTHFQFRDKRRYGIAELYQFQAT